MGAPKQKWTSEEESALKAGVIKHGAGKWRTILKDPEFSGILALRSNVDLKDKWRNMSVTANGWGSREKARAALKRSHRVYKHGDDDDDEGEDDLAHSTVVQSDEESFYAKPLAMSSQVLPITGPKKSLSRLENLILEVINSLNEPTGSDKTTICIFIEDQYDAPANFKKILSAKLKLMTANGKLIKVKRKYRLAPRSRVPSDGGNPGKLHTEACLEGVAQRDIKPDVSNSMRTKSQVDADLLKMRNMTPEEAAAAAARAVAEAEAAIAEAEEAAREADAAELDAEEAQAFAEAAMMTLRNRNASKMKRDIVDATSKVQIR